MTSISPAQLRAYYLGLLSEEEAAEVERRLQSAPRDVIDTFDQAHRSGDTLLADLREPPADDPVLAEPELNAALKRIESLEPAASPSSPPTPASEDEPLHTVGAYELLEKLGEGGMGVVYKARHMKLKKTVALKLLATGRLRNRAAVARFEREMEAAGRLDHPHLIRAMDAGECDGRHFLAMEYVEGHDLAQLSRLCGPLPIADACELVRQAALGLQDAFEHGLVHRDVKPSNLFLARANGRPLTVKVLDLGLALLADAAAAAGHGLTSDGEIMGTLDYMAPEQGGDSRNVDVRADIYALGATLYKLLTGQAVYSGDRYRSTLQKLTALANDPAPPIADRCPGIPPALAAIVHRMLAKDPQQRPATPGEVARALAPWAAGANLEALVARADVGRPRSGIESNAFQSSAWEEQFAAGDSSAIPVGATVAAVPSPTTIAAGIAQPGSRGGRRWGRVLAGAGLLAGLLLGGWVLFKLETGAGTLIVEIAEDAQAEIEARLKDGGLEVFDKRHDRVWTIVPVADSAAGAPQTRQLPSGEYRIAAGTGLRVSDASGVEMIAPQFQLRRGDEVRVRVSLATPLVENRPVAPATDPDRPEPGPAPPSGGTRAALAEQQIQNLEELRALDMSQVRTLALPAQLVTPAVSSQFEAAVNLTAIVLTGPRGEQFTAEQADVLWLIPKLEAVSWTGCVPTVEAVGTLKGLRRLVEVGVEGGDFGDDHLRALNPVPRLRKLSLVDVGVSPVAVHQLAKSHSSLAIEGNVARLDEAAEREVAKWLLSLTAAQLEFTATLTSTGGTRTIGSGGTLPDEGFAITSLRLISATAPGGDWSPLGRLSSVRWLTLVEPANFDDGTLSQLSQLKSAGRIDLVSESVRGPGLNVLKGSPNLQALYLNGCSSLNDSAVRSIVSFHRLENLGFHSAQITDDGFRQIAESGLPLEALDPMHCLRIFDEGFKHVAKLQLLSTLCVPDNVTAAGYRAVLDLPKLHSIGMVSAHCRRDVMEVLAGHPTIARLYVVANERPFQLANFEAAALLPHLRDFAIVGTQPVELDVVQRLHELPHVREISLATTILTAEHLAAIARIESLRTLVLDGCMLTAEDRHRFVEARPDVTIQ